MTRKILVAEDDPRLRKLMVLRLRDAGYEVATADNGVEALAKARRSPPDAIVSDVLMPHMDGFRLCQAVRQDPGLLAVPVVLTSSGTIEQADLVLAQSAGASAYVLRTPECGEVIGALEDSLGQGPAPPAEHNPELLADLQDQFLRDGQMESRSLLEHLSLGFDAKFAQQVAHRWAGVGGTLGYPQLSQLAFQIERQLDSLAPGTAAELHPPLEAIERLFAKTLAEGGVREPAPHGTTAPGSDAAAWSVVVADDDLIVAALVAAALNNHGIRCHLARHGQEALEMIRQLLPNALVLDVNMPGMDGFEVLTKLKDNPLTASIPVVLLTARQQEADVLRGFGLGADDYVVKPFNPLELLARLKRLYRSPVLAARV